MPKTFRIGIAAFAALGPTSRGQTTPQVGHGGIKPTVLFNDHKG